MSLFSMRPTFEMQYPNPKEEFIRQVAVELKKPPWNATSLVFDDYIEMHIQPSDVRYWSPHLSLSFDGDANQTRVIGRFAPRQEVWTLIWIIYLALAFIAFFSFIYAYAQWTLGKSTWIGMIPIIAIAGICLLYVISYIGQQLSSDQMALLRSEWFRLTDQLFPPKPVE